MKRRILDLGRLVLLLLIGAPLTAQAQDDFDAQRRQMVEEIAALARETAFEIAASGGTIGVSPTPRTP